jgi:hypothetical protein
MTLRAGICGATLLLIQSSACVSQSNDALVFTIEQALATAPAGADFGRSVDGDWDRVCIFRPGTPYERVDSVLGAAWDGLRETGIEASEDATLLVFARGSDVAAHVMYPVLKGDFGTPGPEQWYCRPRSDAVFQLRQAIDGSIPWVGPVPRSAPPGPGR